MASAFGDLSPTADAFASAAIDPTRWNAAMDVAASATGSFGALMVPLKGRLPQFPMSDGMQPSVEAYVRDGWINRDVRYRPAPILVKRGVVTEFDFTSPEEMAREPYYQEFLRPHKLGWFGAVKVGEGEDVWCLSIQRTIEQGPFQQSEIDRLAALSNELGGAAALARAFGFARIEAALEAFEASGSPAVVVDRLGEAVRVNRSAERLLGADLQIVRRRVVSSSRDATAALDRALHALIWAGQGGAFHPPVVLPRREGRPILAYPTRLPAIAGGAFAPGQACIVFVDLDARPKAPGEDLIAAFRLTPAEARLAARLLGEESLETAAARLGVSVETARNQLKSVYEKTETHRQAQLVALLARLAKL
ncbi:MAG TPA: helix-turn-helix transcriptional regulator [Roseiarcus sp.]|nr:helix-turn-helix transcriptional regulator [Roseiarcus sp.]